MFCIKCGEELKENSKFCTKCGSEVESEESVSVNEGNTTKQKGNSYLWLNLSIILVIVLLIGGGIYYKINVYDVNNKKQASENIKLNTAKKSDEVKKKSDNVKETSKENSDNEDSSSVQTDDTIANNKSNEDEDKFKPSNQSNTNTNTNTIDDITKQGIADALDKYEAAWVDSVNTGYTNELNNTINYSSSFLNQQIGVATELYNKGVSEKFLADQSNYDFNSLKATGTGTYSINVNEVHQVTQSDGTTSISDKTYEYGLIQQDDGTFIIDYGPN